MKAARSLLVRVSNRPVLHRPPWMEKADMMRTRRLIQPKMNGIQVDIVTSPPIYRAPILVGS
jgi:hypothetical protein